MYYYQRVLLAAVCALSIAATTLADEPVSSRPLVRGQSPAACGPGCGGCDSCSDCDVGWREKLHRAIWRGKVAQLIDFCCLKHRCFRTHFPYNSCYKPLPPFLLDNNGYNTACWRRLSESPRHCPPALVGYPAEVQPFSPLDEDAPEVPNEIAPPPTPAADE